MGTRVLGLRSHSSQAVDRWRRRRGSFSTIRPVWRPHSTQSTTAYYCNVYSRHMVLIDSHCNGSGRISLDGHRLCVGVLNSLPQHLSSVEFIKGLFSGQSCSSCTHLIWWNSSNVTGLVHIFSLTTLKCMAAARLKEWAPLQLVFQRIQTTSWAGCDRIGYSWMRTRST